MQNQLMREILNQFLNSKPFEYTLPSYEKRLRYIISHQTSDIHFGVKENY
jgi:hypothetical protein